VVLNILKQQSIYS